MEDLKGRRRKRTAIAIVVAAVVVIASWVVWDSFIRPRTIREVEEKMQFQPGQEVTVEGTITGIGRENTTDGPQVYLELDDYGMCSSREGFAADVRGDPAVQYRTGDRFRTTLHFAAYRFNGDAAVWAPELVCPFPRLLQRVGAVWDEVSRIDGMLLAYNGTDASGWSSYEFMTIWGDPYRPDVLPLTLRKSIPIQGTNPELPAGTTINSGPRWTTVSGLQYLLVTALFWVAPIVDEMTSLASGNSRNGTLRFVDANGNGLVDDGDHLDVHLPPTGSDTAYDTYMLQIGEANGTRAAYVYGGRYILNGPRGPVETLPSSRTDLRIGLRYVGEQIAARVTTTLEVARTWFGSPPPSSGLAWVTFINGTLDHGNFSDLPVTLPSGISIAFLDGGATGRFDVGDRLVVGNLPNRSSVSLTVNQIMGNYRPLADVGWLAGYGVVQGRSPDVTLTPQGLGPYSINVRASFWIPEFAFNRSIRVSLWENGVSVLSDRPVTNSTVGAFANGTLSFVDANGDGSVGSGDLFTVQGSPARYRLEVSILFGGSRWSTDFGP